MPESSFDPMNSYIAVKYDLPLVVVPDVLVRFCIDVAVYVASATPAELTEETSIPADRIEAITPFAVVQDLQEGIVEICAEVRVAPDCCLQSTRATAEYKQLHWLDRAGCERFLAAHRERFVPASRVAFEQWRSVPI